MTFKWSLFCPDYAISFFLLGWHIWIALAIPSSCILPKGMSGSGTGLEINFLDYYKPQNIVCLNSLNCNQVNAAKNEKRSKLFVE